MTLKEFRKAWIELGAAVSIVFGVLWIADAATPTSSRPISEMPIATSMVDTGWFPIIQPYPGRTTNDNFRIQATNVFMGRSSISVTNLYATNIYTSNFFTTNLIVSNIISSDVLWTNDTALTPSRIRIKTEISDYYTELTNTFTRGYSADDFIFPVLALGNNTLDSDLYSAFLLLSPTNDPAQVIIRLKSPVSANNLELMCYTNAVFTGQCRLEAGSAVSGSGGTVRLNNNQNWDGINGAVIRLRYISPDWIETGRWFAGSNSQPTTITINPTDNYVPVRSSANSFADSPMRIPAAGSTNAIFNGAIFVGTNSFAYWGASDYSIVSIHDVDNGEPNYNGIAVWTVEGSENGAIDGTVTTDQAVLSVGVANGNVGSSIVWSGHQTNLFLDGQFGTNNPSVFRLSPTVEDVVANAAYIFDTPSWQPKASADLLRVRNAGTNLITVGPTGKVIFGPGTTNVLSRNANDLVYTNGGNSVNLEVRKGDGASGKLGLTTGSHVMVLGGTGSDVYVGVNNNGSGDFVFQATALSSTSAGTDDLGSPAVPWDDVYADKVILTGITKAEKALLTPADGMIVYQTDNTPGLRVYVAGTWFIVSTGADP